MATALNISIELLSIPHIGVSCPIGLPQLMPVLRHSHAGGIVPLGVTIIPPLRLASLQACSLALSLALLLSLLLALLRRPH